MFMYDCAEYLQKFYSTVKVHTAKILFHTKIVLLYFKHYYKIALKGFFFLQSAGQEVESLK